MIADPSRGPQIGQALKRARSRLGLDIRTVEERTKIRARYLRALEDEEWGAIPGPAYVKGYLRTYAQLLGLDAEVLVDQFRRWHEGQRMGAYPFAEPALRERRRLEARPSRLGPGRISAIFLAGVGLGVLLLVLGLGGADEDDRGGGGRQRAGEERRASGAGDLGGGGEGGRQRPAPGPITLRLLPRVDGISVCLLGEGRQPLIDGQVLAAGQDEGPYTARRFELRFEFGFGRRELVLFVDGKRARLPATSSPVAYRITRPNRIETIDYPGDRCP